MTGQGTRFKFREEDLPGLSDNNREYFSERGIDIVALMEARDRRLAAEADLSQGPSTEM